VPLGSIEAVVYQDSDGSGSLTDADAPIDRAVLVLDDGARTEASKAGKVRFDAVRFGTHAVTLLAASLPEGAELAGPATVQASMARGVETPRIEFLVKLDKRPELRKVFPLKAPQQPAPAPKAAKRRDGPL